MSGLTQLFLVKVLDPRTMQGAEFSVTTNCKIGNIAKAAALAFGHELFGSGFALQDEDDNVLDNSKTVGEVEFDADIPLELLATGGAV